MAAWVSPVSKQEVHVCTAGCCSRCDLPSRKCYDIPLMYQCVYTQYTMVVEIPLTLNSVFEVPFSSKQKSYILHFNFFYTYQYHVNLMGSQYFILQSNKTIWLCECIVFRYLEFRLLGANYSVMFATWGKNSERWNSWWEFYLKSIIWRC